MSTRGAKKSGIEVMVYVRNKMPSGGHGDVESQHPLEGLGDVILYYRSI